MSTKLVRKHAARPVAAGQKTGRAKAAQAFPGKRDNEGAQVYPEVVLLNKYL
jgi:hypothetical protein